MSPSRHRQRFAGSLALACTCALLFAACHGSSKPSAATKGSTVPSTDAKGQPVSLTLKVGTVQVQAAGTATPFSHTAAASILALMNNYVSDGISRPLFTGSPSTGIVRSFAGSLAARVGAKGRDRPALTDEGVPVITEVTNLKKQPLNLVALEDTSGHFVMVGAQFGLTVTGTTAQGPLTVSRLGNFVFAPNAAHHWVITGYDVIVRRVNGSTATTTTAKQ